MATKLSKVEWKDFDATKAFKLGDADYFMATSTGHVTIPAAKRTMLGDTSGKLEFSNYKSDNKWEYNNTKGVPPNVTSTKEASVNSFISGDVTDAEMQLATFILSTSKLLTEDDPKTSVNWESKARAPQKQKQKAPVSSMYGGSARRQPQPERRDEQESEDEQEEGTEVLTLEDTVQDDTLSDRGTTINDEGLDDSDDEQ